MNIKKDILFLPKWYPHDADQFDGNFIENHAHAIKQIADVKVIFVHSEEHNNSAIYRFDEKDNEGIKELRVYFKKPSTPFAPLNKLITFIRYAKAQRLAYNQLYHSSEPDLVHIHVLARSAFLAMRLKKRKNIPFVITEHWSGYLPESGALKKSGKTAYYKRIGLAASGIHTVTNHLAKAMMSHGIKNEYTVIPNVVKDELFNPRMEKVSSGKIKLLFVGNLLQHPKRIFDIIEVIERLHQSRDDFELTIYGEGTDEKKMLHRIDELGLNNVISYMGTTNREGIAKAMSNADLLFLFSEFENQPCVISESLCCGTAVVVPDIEGIVEFMDKDFGKLFKRLDKDAFFNALSNSMDEIDTFDRKIISEKALQLFGEAAIASQFQDFYNKALSK